MCVCIGPSTGWSASMIARRVRRSFFVVDTFANDCPPTRTCAHFFCWTLTRDFPEDRNRRVRKIHRSSSRRTPARYLASRHAGKSQLALVTCHTSLGLPDEPEDLGPANRSSQTYGHYFIPRTNEIPYSVSPRARANFCIVPALSIPRHYFSSGHGV